MHVRVALSPQLSGALDHSVVACDVMLVQDGRDRECGRASLEDRGDVQERHGRVVLGGQVESELDRLVRGGRAIRCEYRARARAWKLHAGRRRE